MNLLYTFIYCKVAVITGAHMFYKHFLLISVSEKSEEDHGHVYRWFNFYNLNKTMYSLMSHYFKIVYYCKCVTVI